DLPEEPPGIEDTGIGVQKRLGYVIEPLPEGFPHSPIPARDVIGTFGAGEAEATSGIGGAAGGRRQGEHIVGETIGMVAAEDAPSLVAGLITVEKAIRIVPLEAEDPCVPYIEAV